MNILFIGKPTAGKGTIIQRLGGNEFIQLSTGDLLREEGQSGSVLGEEINKLLSQGKFASDEVVFDMVESFLHRHAGKNIVFDGFPRNLHQALSCQARGIVFDKVFLIDVDDETVRQRVVNRRIHPASGRIYNVKTLPPKVDGLDDVTGEPLIQRNDDCLEVINQRLQNYQTLTQPIIDWLHSTGVHIEVIDGQAPLEQQLEKINQLLKMPVNRSSMMK